MAVGARSVGLQKGVRWKPIRIGVFYSVPPAEARLQTVDGSKEVASHDDAR
jgi:hypothetical protein